MLAAAFYVGVVFHVLPHESTRLLLGFEAAIIGLTWATKVVCTYWPSEISIQLEVVVYAATITTIIYLTGWGPILTLSFSCLALVQLSQRGFRTWKITVLWSLAGIVAGQLAIQEGWAKSSLSIPVGWTIAVCSGLGLVYAVRMMAMTMRKQEEAEASVQLSEERFRSLVQNSSDTTMVIGPGMTITYASPASQALLGRTPDDLIRSVGTDLVHPEDRERVERQFASLLETSKVTEPLQFRMLRSDGTWRHVEAVITNQMDNAAIMGYVANVRDITERKESEELLAYQALHDSLTELPNRKLIMERAQQMLVQAREDRQPVAAFFLDLDNFKEINDTLGHEAGDNLLQAVSKRFAGIMRSNDIVGRLGGDEFVVLAAGASLSAGPELVAERLHRALREPFRIEGYDAIIEVTTSIGIASGDRSSAAELLRDADVALYRAKAMGRNCFCLFDSEVPSDVTHKVQRPTSHTG